MTDASDRQLLKAAGRRLLDQDEATPTPGIWAAMVGPSGITVWQRDANPSRMVAAEIRSIEDARLIAAAPSLLAAARALTDSLLSYSTSAEIVDATAALRAAIEEATP